MELVTDLLSDAPGSILTLIVKVEGSPHFVQFTESGNAEVIFDCGNLGPPNDRDLPEEAYEELRKLQFDVDHYDIGGTTQAMKRLAKATPGRAQHLVAESCDVLARIFACDPNARLVFDIVEYRD